MFIDEVDALASNHDSGDMLRPRDAAVQILQRVEGFEELERDADCATNRRQDLTPRCSLWSAAPLRSAQRDGAAEIVERYAKHLA